MKILKFWSSSIFWTFFRLLIILKFPNILKDFKKLEGQQEYVDWYFNEKLVNNGIKIKPSIVLHKRYENSFEYVYWHIKSYCISPITMKFHSFCTLTHNLLAHCGATVARCRNFATLWFMKNHIYAYFLLPINRSYNEMFVCNWGDVDGFCKEARLIPNDKSVSYSGQCWKHSW